MPCLCQCAPHHPCEPGLTRIAKIVPLAVVAAVGVAACGPTNGGSSVAASAPSVSSSATPGAGAVPTTPAPADTTTEATPTTATPAAEAPAEQAPAAVPAKADVKAAAKPPTKAPAKPAGGIGITFNGLHQGQKIQVGNQVSFSVTWKNNDATGTRSVAPVVATQQYEGAQCRRILSMAQGTLERKDAAGWKAMPSLSQGGGTDYAGTGNDAAFTLAAGESRTGCARPCTCPCPPARASPDRTSPSRPRSATSGRPSK
ncbi:hypothetical protein ACGF0D_35085 [Kitasatospora sp. NPDC048298]|uniref:hypothetical protein n=1 Tax=Kitasatospora sp. NPDC048298 TaxID=3364049 RepID=UPI00371EA195